jgi:hypothetical protein
LFDKKNSNFTPFKTGFIFLDKLVFMGRKSDFKNKEIGNGDFSIFLWILELNLLIYE